MKILYFTHSLASCWNHGNAHFQRGVLRQLQRRGHVVESWEPFGNWSFENLVRDNGEAGLAPFTEGYPELTPGFYGRNPDVSELTEGADLVIVHEWTDPDLVARLGELRARGARFTLLFHDTHHRAVSDSAAVRAFDLSGYDAVLAFGETLADVYRGWGWGNRVFVWHEAADTELFHPSDEESERYGLVWIGNWGDGERSREIEDYLLAPARAAHLSLAIHGVRYPPRALAMLRAYGAEYRGWLPNAQAPQIFARHLATVHVPRRHYATMLRGIPTIRMFEAMACGIPLVSAPWDDCEQLFRPGDYLKARDGVEMTMHLQDLARDGELRKDLARSGLETIRQRHTCGHRAEELLAIMQSLSTQRPQEAAA